MTTYTASTDKVAKMLTIVMMFLLPTIPNTFEACS